jgi:hypothetical protein
MAGPYILLHEQIVAGIAQVVPNFLVQFLNK